MNIRDIMELFGKKREENFFESLLKVQSDLNEGIAVIEDMKILYVNEALSHLFGYTEEELLSLDSFLDLVIPEERGRFMRYLEELSTERSSHIGETAIVRKDNERTDIEYAIKMVPKGGHTQFFAVIHDITERKKVESELERMYRDLEKKIEERTAELNLVNERLQREVSARDQFLATLSHELRNPLAPLTTTIELMRMKKNEDPEFMRMIERIDRQFKNLAHLLKESLDTARIVHGKIELQKTGIDLASVLERAVETSRPLIDAGKHTLLFSPPPESVRFLGDPLRLEQVIVNLLNNAAKYTPMGGKIAVTGILEGENIVIRVRDNGEGISPEMITKIFDLFIQEDQSRARLKGGLGVGLMLVRSLAELHGGTVEVSSEGLRKGSEFTVHIPFIPAPVEIARPQADSQLLAEKKGTRKILVVDDNRDAANSLGELLSRLGHDVRVVYDGRSAVSMAFGYEPDMMLLDIGMPNMDGYEVVRILKEKGHTSSAMVALTGYGQEEDKERTKHAGFDHHLVKPVGLGDLRAIGI